MELETMELAMSTDLSQIEYEDRFFGVNLLNVVNFVVDTIMDNIECGLESLGRKLASQFGEEASKEFIASLLGSYRTALQNRSKEIEKAVSDFFTIPNTVVHPEDQIHDEMSDNVEAELDRQIEESKNTCLALSVFGKKLESIIGNITREQETTQELMRLNFASQELQTNHVLECLDSLPLDQILNQLNLNH